MPLRSERALLTGLSIYAIAILGSQATMSLGIGVLLVFAFIAFGGPVPFFKQMGTQMQDPEIKRYLFATNILTAACFISLLFAKFTPVELAGETPKVQFVKDMWKAWYFYWPLATTTCLLALSEKSRKILMQIFFGGFGIVCVIGCFQHFYGWPISQGIPFVPGRYHVTGFPGFHLSFASIMIFPFFVVVGEILDQRWIPRKFAIALSILGFLAIFGTYSRQVWVSLPIGLLVFIVLRLPKREALISIALGAVGVVALYNVPAVQERIVRAFGINERYELWRVNIEFFKMRPLTGIGWHHNLPMMGAYYKQFHPEMVSPFTGHAHSNFFECLGALGAIGVLAYLFWTYTTLAQAFGVGAGFFAAWVVFHLNGLTQVNLWESKVLHAMMWSVAMILSLRILKKKAPPA